LLFFFLSFFFSPLPLPFLSCWLLLAAELDMSLLCWLLLADDDMALEELELDDELELELDEELELLLAAAVSSRLLRPPLSPELCLLFPPELCCLLLPPELFLLAFTA